MKFLLLILALMISTTAFATGKLMVQPTYFADSRKLKPMVGLGIYEKLPGMPVAYNGWFGYGDQAFADRQDVGWYSVRNAVDFYTPSPLVLSPGVQSVLIDGDDVWQHRVFVRATYELW